MKATAQLLLTGARLSVELCRDEELAYLYVRSLLDRTQVFLLPLPQPPAIQGLALATTFGRVHALPWALAYGAGLLSDRCVIAFGSDSLRWRRTVNATPQRLGEGCWVAAVEGVFTTAAAVTGGVEAARVQLATHW